jgi:4-amino-4-deoxy-L-arabinose transferase-like glycosyltransferase
MAWALVGLATLTLIRLAVAAVIPLAPDEAYYWVWSRALAPGYLDHPPMVALWIRAGTALAGSGSIGVRLLGPISGVLGSFFLYDAAERLFPGGRAGLTAAALLNATLALGIGTEIMTPDTPLLLFWAATLWAGARLASGGAPAWWLAAGAFSGLALASKYTAGLLPIGMGLFALIAAPRWLRRPEPWLGALVAGLLFLPVLIWNARNGWAGFLRQGGRVFDWRPEQAVGNIGELLLGQIGMATPGIFILFTAGVAVAVVRTMQSRDPAWTLLMAMSVPALVLFSQHAVGGRVQGNWPAIVYPASAAAAAGLPAAIWRRLTWPSIGLGLVVTATVYGHVVTAWPTASARNDPIARQLFGWETLAARAENARHQAGAEFVAVEPYGLAAELARGLPAGVQVIGAGAHWEPTTLLKAEIGQREGILVRPEAFGGPDPAAWRDWTRLTSIVRNNGDVVLERYSVFLVRAVAGSSSTVVVLPHP